MAHAHMDIGDPESRQSILGVCGGDFLHRDKRFGIPSRLGELDCRG
jgi:hypothetical protein